MCEAMSATKELSAKGLIYCVIAQSKLDSLLCRYHSNISSINYDIDDVHLVKNSLESTNVLLTSKIAQYIAYTSVLYNTLAIEAAEQSSLDAKDKEAGYDDDNKKWISLRSSIYLSLRDLVHSHILGMKAFIKFYVQQLAIVSYSVRKSVVFREFTNLLETSATLLSQLLSLLTNVGLLKYCSNEKNGAQNYFSIVNSVIQSEGIHLLEDLFRLTTAIPSDADLLIPTFKKDIESSSLGFNSFDDELLIPMTNRSSGAKLSNINNRKDTISTSISKSLEHSRWLIFSTIFKIVEINSRSSFDECKSKVLASVDEKMFNAITVDDSTAIESVLKFPITNYLHDAKSDILFSNEMCVRHSLLGDGFGKSEEFDYSLALSEVDSVPTNTSAIVELRVLLKLLAKYFAFTSITDAEGDPFYNKSDSENNSNSNNNYRRLLESIRSNIYHHIFDVKMSLTAKYSLYLAEGSASKCGAHKIASTRFLNKLLLSASLSNLLLFNYCYLTTDNSSDVVNGSKRKELLISRSGALLDELRSIICMENNMFELGSYVHGDIEYASDKKEEAAKLLEKLLRKLGYSFKFGHAIFRLILQTLLHSNQVATNSIGNPYLSPTVESSQFGSPNSGLGSPARTKEPIIQAMRDILAQLLISGNWEKGIYFTNLFIKRFQRDNNHVSFAANNIGSTINTYMFDSPTNKSTSNFGYMNNNFAEKERFDSITSEFSRIKDLFEEKLKSDGLLRLFPNYYVLRIISSKPFGELNNSCPTGIDNTTTSTINDGNDLQDYITSKFSALLGDISIERYAFVAKTADESDLHLSQSDTSPSNSNCGYEYWLLLKFDMTANASCINFYEEYLMSKKLAIEKLRFVGDRSSNEQDSKPTTETLLSPVSYHIVLSEVITLADNIAFIRLTLLRKLLSELINSAIVCLIAVNTRNIIACW